MGAITRTGPPTVLLTVLWSDVVDTLGAGDAFVAAMLTQLMQHTDLTSLKKVRLDTIMRYANAAGALATQKVGVIPSLPTPSEIEGFLHR